MPKGSLLLFQSITAVPQTIDYKSQLNPTWIVYVVHFPTRSMCCFVTTGMLLFSDLTGQSLVYQWWHIYGCHYIPVKHINLRLFISCTS